MHFSSLQPMIKTFSTKAQRKNLLSFYAGLSSFCGGLVNLSHSASKYAMTHLVVARRASVWVRS